MTNAHRIVFVNPKGKIPLGRQRHIREDDITIDLKEMGYEDMDSVDLA
jgi:hypothetical protein